MVVVPCFDEEKRLDRARFLALAKEAPFDILFVDDGSRDQTKQVLEDLADQNPEKIRVLALEKNGGKGEAVRQGMLQSLARGTSIVGYADADLSTPPDELIRLFHETERSHASVVLGARVLLIGRRIERKRMRHALGRVFATIAEFILETPFYDTQCGAKFFRNGESLRVALANPFSSRWAFDVELLGRLLVGNAETPGLPLSEFLEVPLREWVDIGGSKLRFGGMARSLIDLAIIEADLRRRRADQKK